MPLVSVLLSVHNGSQYVGAAVESVLRQTVSDFELVVVDDASTDETPAILAAQADPRLLVVRNSARAGLASSLNRALDEAKGRYVARLDADDVALRARLERQLARISATPAVGLVGTAVLDLDETDHLGALHRNPVGPRGVRWLALFGSPFFHPTVLVDRTLLDGHGLRYDPEFAESEDYDLWTRLLRFTDGANLDEPLVLKRVHPGQASLRRRDVQESFQRRVGLREIAELAPELSSTDAELAWRLGSGRGEAGAEGAAALVRLLGAFEDRHVVDPEVRAAAALVLLRASPRHALAVGIPQAGRLALGRARRQLAGRKARRAAAGYLDGLEKEEKRVRVTVVSPEPTPYRAPLFDRVAAHPEIELTVIYAAETVAGRSWSVERNHASSFLRGVRVPGLQRVFHHDYPVTPGIVRALRTSRPEVVVVSGWSTFASQAAIAWSRLRDVPYLPLVESHDLGPRARWRRAVKGAVVPRVLRGAAGALALGSASRESLVARGARRAQIRVFANTIDVRAWEDRADALRARRDQLRKQLGAEPDDVLVLSVARLGREKGLDTLVRAAAETRDARLLVVLVGDGPERASLEQLANELGVRLHLAGDRPGDEVAEAYVAADVFALLSARETWGVVVNEAAASGLPLVLSNRVGAAYDLLRDGENGMLVPAEDVVATTAALARVAADAAFRGSAGRRSRELIAEWGYEPSVESFVAAVREAAAR